jgi:hypothetical protein
MPDLKVFSFMNKHFQLITIINLILLKLFYFLYKMQNSLKSTIIYHIKIQNKYFIIYFQIFLIFFNYLKNIE